MGRPGSAWTFERFVEWEGLGSAWTLERFGELEGLGSAWALLGLCLDF